MSSKSTKILRGGACALDPELLLFQQQQVAKSRVIIKSWILSFVTITACYEPQEPLSHISPYIDLTPRVQRPISGRDFMLA